MRFIVPQNITLEDKVIGPLTLKQFFYLLGGAMVGFVVYSSVKGALGQIGGLLATLPTNLIAFAFAFLKINDQPFMVFFGAILGYLLKPRFRLWQRVTDKVKMVNTQPKKLAAVKTKRVAKKGDLANLAQLVDSRGWQASEVEGRVTSATEQKQVLKLG